MRYLSKFAFFALLFVGAVHGVNAQQQPILNFVGPSMRVPAFEAFDGYQEECGFPIVFERTKSRAEAKVTDDGEKIIVLDPSFISGSGNKHRAFLVAHECSHHLMGHTSTPGLKFRRHHPNGVIDQELAADCMAGEILRRHAQVDTIDFAARLLFRMGPYSPGGRYPSGMRRAVTLRNCADVPLGSVGLFK